MLANCMWIGIWRPRASCRPLSCDNRLTGDSVTQWHVCVCALGVAQLLSNLVYVCVCARVCVRVCVCVLCTFLTSLLSTAYFLFFNPLVFLISSIYVFFLTSFPTSFGHLSLRRLRVLKTLFLSLPPSLPPSLPTSIYSSLFVSFSIPSPSPTSLHPIHQSKLATHPNKVAIHPNKLAILRSHQCHTSRHHLLLPHTQLSSHSPWVLLRIHFIHRGLGWYWLTMDKPSARLTNTYLRISTHGLASEREQLNISHVHVLRVFRITYIVPAPDRQTIFPRWNYYEVSHYKYISSESANYTAMWCNYVT